MFGVGVGGSYSIGDSCKGCGDGSDSTMPCHRTRRCDRAYAQSAY